MKIRTDLVFLVIAMVLGGVGLFMGSQAAFAQNYVRDQLTAEGITFTAADKLTAEEKSWKPGSSCLTEYAGQKVTTGKQAECYGSFYIGLHTFNAGNAVGYPGTTYATISSASAPLKADLATAQKNNDTAAIAALQKKVDAVTAARETMFKGEMLKATLLTVYGFSVLGDVAGTAGSLSYAGAALFVILAAYAFMRGRAPVAVLERQPSGGVVSAR